MTEKTDREIVDKIWTDWLEAEGFEDLPIDKFYVKYWMLMDGRQRREVLDMVKAYEGAE